MKYLRKNPNKIDYRKCLICGSVASSDDEYIYNCINVEKHIKTIITYYVDIYKGYFKIGVYYSETKELFVFIRASKEIWHIGNTIDKFSLKLNVDESVILAMLSKAEDREAFKNKIETYALFQ